MLWFTAQYHGGFDEYVYFGYGLCIHGWLQDRLLQRFQEVKYDMIKNTTQRVYSDYMAFDHPFSMQ